MYFKKLSWIIPCIICGCATTLKEDKNILLISNPPNLEIDASKDELSIIYFLEAQRKTSVDPSAQVWSEYKLAKVYQEKKDPRACQLFSQLAINKDFPLYREAGINQLQSCDTKFSEKDVLAEIKDLSDRPWLKLIGLEASIQIAKKLNKKNELIQLYLEKSKLPLDQNEKVKYTQKALKLAIKYSPQEKNMLKSRLEKLSPKFIKKPKFNDYLKVAYDNRRSRKFKKALWFYKAVAKNSKTNHYNRIKALTGISRTYKIMGEKEKHIKSANDLAIYTKSKFLKDKKKYAELLHDNYLSLARANWTQGHVQLANKTLNIMIKLLKNYFPLSQVYLTKARMSEETSNFKAAIDWLNKSYSEDTSTEQKEIILWHLAWNLKKLDRFQESVVTFHKLLKLEPPSDNKAKYTFWLAKTLKQMKKFEDADELFEDTIIDDPYGYYGLLAHNETHNLLKLPYIDRSMASDTVTTNDKKTLSKYLDTKYLDWLISLDEYEITESYLDFSMSLMKKKDFIETTEWLALFHYYAKSGNFLKLFEQIGKIPAEQRKILLSENPELIFPKPFYNEVFSAAQKFGISVEYIYSIMRQESAFNPKARSHMDAFGLMQLLPEVANKYAKTNKIELTKAEDLFQPQVSIPLGAAHLRELWDKYNGRFILATASYNANDKAIQNWIKTRYRGDSLEFIEDIPYKETQSYIKLVMRNLIFYNIVNSSNKIVSFPSWALEI
ncbi:MAG: transglycosylase SLT domain-containing protein [Bdellovibrionaceae bacterium]|nr:transglycosylase SLT domain-containing protein [Pseudobdellovibrionaceae bacterium]